MKIDRHGRAKILTQAEIQLLFSSGLENNRSRALFGVCLYTACRINEACTIRTVDVYDTRGRVRPELTIRKGNTKGKLATRSVPVIEDLRLLLTNYSPPPASAYLFPGRHGKGHINSDSAARILREACQRVGIEGVSTHSFRRTALTQMSDTGIPLRVIQEVSGHRTLTELQKYLEVRPEQVRGAVAALSMLSHVTNVATKNEGRLDTPPTNRDAPTTNSEACPHFSSLASEGDSYVGKSGYGDLAEDKPNRQQVDPTLSRKDN